MGTYIRLVDYNTSEEKQKAFFHQENRYLSNQQDFTKIPGNPIAYWVSNNVLHTFSQSKSISDVALPKQGLSTCNNELFLRLWYEIPINQIAFGCKDRNASLMSNKKWFPYNKGGAFRKWYGNNEFILNWERNGQDIHKYNNLPLDYNGAPVRGKNYYFKEGMTWSSLAGIFSGRLSPHGFAFDAKGPVLFSKDSEYPTNFLMGCLNSKPAMMFLGILAPTLDFNQGPIGRMPLPLSIPRLGDSIDRLIRFSRNDWNSSETSWDFTLLPLLDPVYRQPTLVATFDKLRTHWQDIALEMQGLEEENNRIFIEAYGLQNELTPEIPLNEITLTSNPHYHYGDKKSAEELETLLLTDTMNELISYGVGCVFGRYSLDMDGLILANTGDGVGEYLTQIPNPSFPPDKSGILPLTDADDFPDDLPNQFKTFLKSSFGSEKFQENLHFVEEAVGKDIRNYFLKDFYKDHVKRYKKRPIYWMIASPSGAFRALIYLHRYTKDTISLFLNDYLRPYQRKLEAKEKGLEHTIVSVSASGAEKTKAQKKIDKLRKDRKELEQWERDVVYPLATQRIELDLDDGVKVNYGKLGSILEKVKGLNA